MVTPATGFKLGFEQLATLPEMLMLVGGVGDADGAGVGVAVHASEGTWIETVIGEPVLKKPTVAFALVGGRSESKRKLYIVPKRIAFAFWFWANVSVFQVKSVAV